jgi:hypothetical protein
MIAVSATPPPVPVLVQQAIARRTPQLAYAPTRIPIGYRYLKWRWAQGDGALRIWFRNKGGKEIVFISTWQYGACAAGREKTFQLAGNKVYWGHRAEEQQAWRCVKLPSDASVKIQLTAATPQPPTQFADVGLGRVAASARKIA